MKVVREELNNGIPLYKIRIPDAKTIGISINVKIGSIYEDKDKRGISHFLEHMMFKSNKRYTSQQISMGLELNGGICNAFTSNILTSYFVEVIPQGFEKVVDILYSMFENDKFDEKEFELEKKVVLTEIERYENNPEDLMDRLIPKSVFGESDYGEPISGYRETVEFISKKDLEDFKSNFYRSNEMFIILEGNFKQKHVRILNKYFSKLEEGKTKKKKPSISDGKDIVIKHDTKNQIYFSRSHVVDINRKTYHLPFAFSEIVSGGISSLTFNTIREKYGIGYSVYFEPTYIFENKLILSLAIPGFEKEKESLLEKAIKEFENSIFDKNLEKYVKGRKERIKLKFEKLRTNLFERLRKEAFLIHLFEETLENLYNKILKVSAEEIRGFYEKLGEGRIVKILPK